VNRFTSGRNLSNAFAPRTFYVLPGAAGSGAALLWASLPLRPLLSHTTPLADGVAPARPVLDCRIKHGACLVNAVAGVQQPDDVLIVFRPQLDLEEVAPVSVVG